MERSAEATRYEIVVRGRLSRNLASAFAGMTIRTRPGQSVLTGEFRDQSQLHGLLDRLQDFGVDLVSVNAVD
jgi:hypothetical protein